MDIGKQMPKHQRFQYTTRFYTVCYTTFPTAADQNGCDGLYVESVEWRSRQVLYVYGIWLVAIDSLLRQPIIRFRLWLIKTLAGELPIAVNLCVVGTIDSLQMAEHGLGYNCDIRPCECAGLPEFYVVGVPDPEGG